MLLFYSHSIDFRVFPQCKLFHGYISKLLQRLEMVEKGLFLEINWSHLQLEAGLWLCLDLCAKLRCLCHLKELWVGLTYIKSTVIELAEHSLQARCRSLLLSSGAAALPGPCPCPCQGHALSTPRCVVALALGTTDDRDAGTKMHLPFRAS